MDIKSVASIAMQGAQVKARDGQAGSESEWENTFNAALEGEAHATATAAEGEADITATAAEGEADITATAAEGEADIMATAAEGEADVTATAAEGEADVTATTAEAETPVVDAQVRVVRFLDGATNTTKTGYVIDGMAYEDQAGTIPVSDYSRFTTADGVLQIKTPYGVMRSADFARLLEYQSRYDTETFGEAIINKNGDIIGSVNFTGGGMTVGAPRDSYTSAPGGPGTVSREIYDKYYTSVAGTSSTVTVAEAVSGSGDGEASEAASGTQDGTDAGDVAEMAAYGTADLSECAFDSSALETAFTKTMLSAAGNALADSIMNDIASIVKTMNASRYHDILDTLTQ